MSNDQKFLNPYNFVPVESDTVTVDAGDIAQGRHERIRHDAWQADALHGRITCKLTAETPLVIGGSYSIADKKKTTPKLQHPYRRRNADGSEELAIPGNSLRGMIGSAIEALSNSALRVLEDKEYKVRLRSGKRTVPATARQFFSAISGDLVPWSSERSRLTPAEVLLGCVSSNDRVDPDSLAGFASRLRFRDALVDAEEVNEDQLLGTSVKLQILSKPEPPSPSLYFQFTKSEGAVKKHDLVQANPSVKPRGRKWYLHHQRSNNRAFQPWVSRAGNADTDNSQRIVARPIRLGTRFGFTIEFSNLSLVELELLCAALAPHENYRHKLGLGKPLGLGTVRLEVETIRLDQRDYEAYSRASLDSLESDDLPSRAYNSFESLAKERPDIDSEQSLIKPLIRPIFETLGDPDRVNLPVCYPRTQAQFSAWKRQGGGQEDKLFEWFVNNDRSQPPQALPRVQPGQSLQGLRTNNAPRSHGGKKQPKRR